MKSIFANRITDVMDGNLLKNPTFFSQIPDLELQLSELIVSRATTWCFKIFLPYLVKYDRKGEISKIINLNLSIFEPFCDKKNDSYQFGFYLNSEPYLVEDEKTLLKLHIFLKNVCIFSHIQEDFVLLKELGRGSTSIVYLAETVSREGPFAIKNIKKSFLENQSHLISLYKEISILKHLSHPHICSLLQIYEDEENIYLIFEYISDCSLLKFLSIQKQLNESSCRDLIKTLLQTVEYLHDLKIVHRDIKLENIMILNEKTLDFKLIDFGLAFLLNEPNLSKCGTPGYIAPEILRNESYNEKVDIFSIGIVFYTLIHGHLPFQGKTLNAILRKNLNCHVKLSNFLSPEALQVLIKMLNPDPNLRPSSSDLLSESWFIKSDFISGSCSNIPLTDTYLHN
jgi:serine/threonine protein kinase